VLFIPAVDCEPMSNLAGDRVAGQGEHLDFGTEDAPEPNLDQNLSLEARVNLYERGVVEYFWSLAMVCRAEILDQIFGVGTLPRLLPLGNDCQNESARANSNLPGCAMKDLVFGNFGDLAAVSIDEEIPGGLGANHRSELSVAILQQLWAPTGASRLVSTTIWDAICKSLNDPEGPDSSVLSDITTG